MDPDETLTQLRDAINIIDYDPFDIANTERVVDLFKALDQWMTRGGFPPQGWR